MVKMGLKNKRARDRRGPQRAKKWTGRGPIASDAYGTRSSLQIRRHGLAVTPAYTERRSTHHSLAIDLQSIARSRPAPVKLLFASVPKENI